MGLDIQDWCLEFSSETSMFFSWTICNSPLLSVNPQTKFNPILFYCPADVWRQKSHRCHFMGWCFFFSFSKLHCTPKIKRKITWKKRENSSHWSPCSLLCFQKICSDFSEKMGQNGLWSISRIHIMYCYLCLSIVFIPIFVFCRVAIATEKSLNIWWK